MKVFTHFFNDFTQFKFLTLLATHPPTPIQVKTRQMYEKQKAEEGMKNKIKAIVRHE